VEKKEVKGDIWWILHFVLFVMKSVVFSLYQLKVTFSQSAFNECAASSLKSVGSLYF